MFQGGSTLLSAYRESHLQGVVLQVPAVMRLIAELAAVSVVAPLEVMKRRSRALRVGAVRQAATATRGG